MTERRKTTLTRPTDRAMVITRVLDAPRLRAWTDPERLARWWRPNGFSITTHEMAFKEDGF